MPYLQTQPDGSLLLSIYVQPRSHRNAIVGLHGDAVKMRLTAPPVDGKANKAVIAFWAKSLKIPKSAITMKSGLHNRMKKILLKGVQEKQIRDLVECHL
ncbi:MAG: YggU family protein [Candidatus Electrothrix sp. LOE1_4_5]|nr:YggU family protein [Candidatus Electrothrix sp. AX1]MCI5116531.1 YggU family protein [Candidatus Electrothrix gigas]MCI5177815.1 YggU family protein [Candidatus Electrothrix gigas]MCI5182095.1 YggU family protein [Candidatus Electrothrix gigas]